MSFVLVVRCCHCVSHCGWVVCRCVYATAWYSSFIFLLWLCRTVLPLNIHPPGVCHCVYMYAMCGVSFFVFLRLPCDWVVCFRFVYCHCVVPSLRVWFVASNFRTVWLLLTVLLSFYRNNESTWIPKLLWVRVLNELLSTLVWIIELKRHEENHSRTTPKERSNTKDGMLLLSTVGALLEFLRNKLLWTGGKLWINELPWIAELLSWKRKRRNK